MNQCVESILESILRWFIDYFEKKASRFSDRLSREKFCISAFKKFEAYEEIKK